MNFSVLPDFLAIGGVVLAFGALLRRTHHTHLRYWLVGWVLVLVHIVAQFVSQNAPNPIAVPALALSLIMLLFTSGAFIWASDDMRRPVDAGELWTILLVFTPDALMYGCLVYDIQPLSVYAMLSLAGLGASLWWFCGGRRMRDRRKRNVRAALLLGVYAVQFMLLYIDQGSMALNWSLFWHFLAAAVFFRMATPSPGIGVRFTAISFLAWALVFPLAVAMGVLLPHVQIEHEVWNLPKFLVATGLIFTLLEEQMNRAEHAAEHDELTGLPNRRLFMRQLHKAVLETRKQVPRRNVMAVLVIDLDGFKKVNDTHGHAVGDRVLCEVAARFTAVMRQGDTLARLGGDEFAAIVPGLPHRDAAREVARKLELALWKALPVTDQGIKMQASIGLAVCPDDAADEARLYAHADRDMYSHKPGRSAPPKGSPGRSGTPRGG